MDETRRNGQAPRAVLLCSAAFFCVCALCAALLARGLWPALLGGGLFACALAVPALLLREGRYRAVACGLILGALCCTAHGLLAWRPALALAGRSGVCRVAVTEEARGYGGYGVVWGRLLTLDGVSSGARVKLYVRDGSPDWAPGDLLTLEGSVREAPRAPRAGMLQRGVLLTVRQTGALRGEENGAATPLTRLRRLSAALRGVLSRMLSGDEMGLLLAMLTGDSSACSAGFLRALGAAGLRHVIAVSGLHLSILAGFLVRVLGRRAGSWAALPVVFTYAALAGFPASAVRAAVMQGFVLAAFLLRRENDSPTALGVSLLLLCALNPAAALSAGLQLSFAATAGILWAAGPLAARLNARAPRHAFAAGLRRYLGNTLAVTLAATAFTLPVTLLQFGSASLLSLPMNLLCLWAISLALLLGVAGAVVTALIPAAGAVCGFFAYWPLRWLTLLIGAAGRLPWAAARASLYLVLAAAGLLLLLALLRRGAALRGTAALCLGLLCLCVGLSSLETRLVTRIDVGDAGGAPIIALRSGGETAFVGAGASDAAAGTLIRAEMARAAAAHSAFLLTTGAGWRQTGGLREALAAAGAARLYLPAGAKADDSAAALCYTESGNLTLGGLTVSLRPVGTGSLCLISDGAPRLLSLCGLEPWAACAALAETPPRVPLLLIDEPWQQAPEALGRVCALTGARAIVLADGGFSAPPARLCGLPVLALSETGTISLETVR